MKKILLLSALSLTLLACERHHKTKETERNAPQQETEVRTTKTEVRTTITPSVQVENETDRTINERIRQEIMADDFLSVDAKNIKISTDNGVVTLSGTVANEDEKIIIESKSSKIPGVEKVDNQLEVVHSAKL